MNLLIILSHDLTDVQIKEAEEKLGIKGIKTLPVELKQVWADINPKGELPIKGLKKIAEWILRESKENDFVLIQGDFGGTFYLVDFCFKNNRIPIYATSKREVEEIRKGNEVLTNRKFRHLNFRRYKRYEK